MQSTTEDRPVLSDQDQTESRTKLWTMIRDIKFAMLTTRNANGHLHSRPVTTQNSNVDEDASLWFFLSRRGDPVAELQNEPSVNAVYADTSADRYVSVSGIAEVVEDAAKKKQLWSKLAEAWFPGGADDPDLALVRVKILHAGYWDVKENKLVQLYKMAKAAMTGEPPKDLGEHAEIKMR